MADLSSIFGSSVYGDPIAFRRSIAAQMLKSAMDTSPAQHWTQGAARIAQGLMAGMDLRDLEKSDAADRAQRANLPGLVQELSGASAPVAGSGGAPERPPPASGPSVTPGPNMDRAYRANEANPIDDMAGPPPGPPTAPRPATGKFALPDRAYRWDEANPIDAQVLKPAEIAAVLKMKPEDFDKMTRTVIGEAGNESEVGKQSVASTIFNRSRMSNQSPSQVVTAPGQFEPWSTEKGRARMMVGQDTPAYNQAAQAVYAATQADPTGGATHFYSPGAQASLGRQPPSWDNGTGQMIGNQKFFNLPIGNQPAPAGQPQPISPPIQNMPYNPAQPPTAQTLPYDPSKPPPLQMAQAPGQPQAQPQGQPGQSPERNIANIPPNVAKFISDNWNSKNPVNQKMAADLYERYTKPVEWDIKTGEDGSTIAVNKNNPSDRRVLPAPPELAAGRAAQEGAKARAKERGEAQGKIEANLPESMNQVDMTLKTIDQIRNHPGRQWGVGAAANVMGVVPNTDARAFTNLVNQAKSQTFRQAFESLRGGGSISNSEGMKAEGALARLDRAVSQKDFDEALDDFQDVMVKGRQSLMTRAQGGGMPATQSAEGGWTDISPGVRIREKK